MIMIISMLFFYKCKNTVLPRISVSRINSRGLCMYLIRKGVASSAGTTFACQRRVLCFKSAVWTDTSKQ
jgi:hypothetical protein